MLVHKLLRAIAAALGLQLCGLPVLNAANIIQCVDSSASLTTALTNVTNAPNNGDSDEIRIRAGKYFAPPGGWTATLSTARNLRIEGGYLDPSCSQQNFNAAATTLDGNHASTVLTIASNFSSASIVVAGLTFEHGVGTAAIGTPAGGLKIADPGPIHNGPVLIQRNIFRANEASLWGGGLVAATDGDHLTVRTNLFIGNTAPNFAAAYLFSNNSIFFANNTVVANPPSDKSNNRRSSVGYITFTGLFLDNNVFWHNVFEADVYDIDFTGQVAGVTAVNNHFEATIGTPLSQKNSAYGDPHFIDADQNLRPRWKSPLIDAGVGPPSGGLAALDVDGGIRLDGDGVDIGAFESNYVFVESFD